MGHRCDGQLATAVARHGHARVPRTADAVRRRARRLQARGVPAAPGAVGRPDQPLPRDHHLGAELRLCAARLDPRTRRTRPASICPACAWRSTAPNPSTTATPVAWPRRGHDSDCVQGRSPRLTGWPRPRWRSPFDNSPRVNVDRISRSDLQERALATPDAGTDACRVVSVGLPVAAVEIRVVDHYSRPRRPRHVGSIEVRGAAVSERIPGRARVARGGHPCQLVAHRRPRLLRRTRPGCTSAAAPRT